MICSVYAVRATIAVSRPRPVIGSSRTKKATLGIAKRIPVPARSGGSRERKRGGRGGSTKAITKPSTTEITTSSSCCRAGVPYSWRCSHAQLEQKRWLGLETQPSVSRLRSLRNPLLTSPTAARGMPTSGLFIGGDLGRAFGPQRPFDGAPFVGLRVWRGEVLG